MPDLKRPLLASLLLVCGALARAQEPPESGLCDKVGVSDLVFNEKADKIAVRYLGYGDKTFIYEFPSLRRLGDIGVSNTPHSTRFSPCGKFAAVGSPNKELNSAVSVWNIDECPPRKIATVKHTKDSLAPESIFIQHIRFSPDSKKIYALSGLTFHAWDWLESAQPVTSLELHGSSRFLSHDTVFNLRGLPGNQTAEVLRFDGKKLKKIRDLGKWPGAPEGYFITPDGTHAVVTDLKDTGSTPVVNLEKPGGQVVDRMLDHWLPKRQRDEIQARVQAGPGGSQDEPFAERCYVPASAITQDLSVIIHYYEVHEGGACVMCGFGFFPRTSAKAKELGVDLKKHTHLFLPVPKKMLVPPPIVLSPNGRWLAFTADDLPPRIWEVETLGKFLLAEKNIQKRWHPAAPTPNK